jgi:hypothetical protein
MTMLFLAAAGAPESIKVQITLASRFPTETAEVRPPAPLAGHPLGDGAGADYGSVPWPRGVCQREGVEIWPLALSPAKPPKRAGQSGASQAPS